MNIILPEFSTRLKCLRKGLNLKQEDIAEYLQCSIRQYQRLEYGEVNVPALSLIALADYFSVTTDYLLGRSEDSETKNSQ